MESSSDIFKALSWFRADRVAHSRVMVVGCGALGNEVVKSLSMFGVGTVVVVDFDHVELGNLSRSVLFSMVDVERAHRKVDAIKASVKALNPDVRIVGIDGDIATHVGLSLIRSMDLIIGCVDNRWARYCINRLAFRAGVAWVDGGIDGMEGTVRVFEMGHNCYGCSIGENGLKELSYRVSCSSIVQHNRANDRVATTPIVASIIGAVQVQEAMKILHRDVVEEGVFTSLRGKMFYYEGEHLTTKVVGFEAYDDECPLHEEWRDIESSHLSADQSLREVLQKLSEMMECERVTIELLNHSFVEYIECRDGYRRDVMIASYMVEDFIEHDPQLRGVASSMIYQREWHELSGEFPYLDMTLKELGIPHWDVLQVAFEGGIRHIALDADRTYYE